MSDKTKFDYFFQNGDNIFFTSDTHFYHENIINFCNRPFENVNEMNEKLIIEWNNIVPKDGLVFHLGDFAWGGYEKWKNVIEQLNGNIILIEGNHDRKNMTTKTKELFNSVTQQLYVKIENRQVYMNHYPFLCYAGTYRNKEDMVYALNGHIHYGPLNKKGKDNERMNITFPTQYDVGVDMNNFKPITWKELNEKIQTQIENNTNMTQWIK